MHTKTFFFLPCLKFCIPLYTEKIITSAKTLYPHNLIITSVSPAPYKEYDVSSLFRVKNFSVPISCVLINTRLASNNVIIIANVVICFIITLFFNVFLSTPSKNILNVTI